jgi:F-type H+-transporting ATPase subunit alpha
MRDYIKDQHGALVKRMEDVKDLAKDDEQKLHEALKDWKKSGSF